MTGRTLLVHRGGSWGDHARFARAACRVASDSLSRDDLLGLRLSRRSL
jgi:hypothetical protein